MNLWGRVNCWPGQRPKPTKYRLWLINNPLWSADAGSDAAIKQGDGWGLIREWSCKLYSLGRLSRLAPNMCQLIFALLMDVPLFLWSILRDLSKSPGNPFERVTTGNQSSIFRTNAFSSAKIERFPLQRAGTPGSNVRKEIRQGSRKRFPLQGGRE